MCLRGEGGDKGSKQDQRKGRVMKQTHRYLRDLRQTSSMVRSGNHVAALIEDFIFHGDHVRVKLSAPGMSEIYVKTPARGTNLPAKGVAVTLSWEPASARAFAS